MKIRESGEESGRLVRWTDIRTSREETVSEKIRERECALR